MKRILSALLLLSVIFCTVITAYAADKDISVTGKTVISTDDIIYEVIDNGTRWEVDEYIGEGGQVELPVIFNDMLVVAIGDHAFANNTNVTEVITWAPLYRIEDHAFVDCTTLEKMQLNYATEYIGMGAFSGTTSLKNINLQDTVVTVIKPYAFLNSGIENITLPPTCTKIDNYAFGQCYSLSKIMIPDSVTEIHEDAFKLCDNLVIYARRDSYAIAYAKENGIPYVIIETYMVGDADGDNDITIADVTTIQRTLAGFNADKDGMITLRGHFCDDTDQLNIIDATLIQRHLVNMPVKLANIGETVTVEFPVIE